MGTETSFPFSSHPFLPLPPSFPLFSFSSPPFPPLPILFFFILLSLFVFLLTNLVSRCLIRALQWDKLFTKSRRGKYTHMTLQDTKLACRPNGRLWTECVPAPFGSCLWIVLRRGWRRAACLPDLHPSRHKDQTDTAREFKEMKKPWEHCISEEGDSLYIICILLQTAHMKNIFSFALKICRMQNPNLSFLGIRYVTLLPILLGHCQGNFPNYPKQLKDT